MNINLKESLKIFNTFNLEKFIIAINSRNNNENIETISQIKDRIKYEIKYNKKNKKIIVDISKNDILSCYDNEIELLQRMKTHIINEDYENAKALLDYCKIIEVLE